MQPVTAKPLYICMHADDNVAIVANRGGLHRGAEFACGLRLIEQIPQGHKVALADIGQGEIIRRYGEVIGHAAAPIARGGVQESLVQMPDGRRSTICRRTSGGAIRLPPLEGYTFEGYAIRRSGHPQHLAISTSVNASRHGRVASTGSARSYAEYPNVDDVVAITHAMAAGRDQRAGAAVPIRTLQNLARNPNFGGEVMIVVSVRELPPELLLPRA